MAQWLERGALQYPPPIVSERDVAQWLERDALQYPPPIVSERDVAQWLERDALQYPPPIVSEGHGSMVRARHFAIAATYSVRGTWLNG